MGHPHPPAAGLVDHVGTVNSLAARCRDIQHETTAPLPFGSRNNMLNSWRCLFHPPFLPIPYQPPSTIRRLVLLTPDLRPSLGVATLGRFWGPLTNGQAADEETGGRTPDHPSTPDDLLRFHATEKCQESDDPDVFQNILTQWLRRPTWPSAKQTKTAVGCGARLKAQLHWIMIASPCMFHRRDCLSGSDQARYELGTGSGVQSIRAEFHLHERARLV